MDLKQLTYFVRVAELGSFTRAADTLQIAQPALSRQVRLLEVELRQALLVRNGRGALPTEAGQILLEHARGILHQVERAQQALAQLRGACAGRVAIGLPPTLAKTLAVPLTRAFREHLPQAQCSIIEGLSATMQDHLIHGRLDLAVLYNAAALPDLDLQPLGDETLMLVQARHPGLPEAPPPAPISAAELATLPLVIPSRPNAIRMHVESLLAASGYRPTIALEIDGVSAILDLVAEGMGYAVLSRNAVESSIRPSAYCMRTICTPPWRIRLSLASSAQRPTTPTQRATVPLIQAACQSFLGLAS